MSRRLAPGRFGIARCWGFGGPVSPGAAPGTSRLKAQKTISTFIPSLVAILSAAEESHGLPLMRQAVEQIVSNSAVIAMEPGDALHLERTRGYADIEPELAWEQWQIVRRASQ